MTLSRVAEPELGTAPGPPRRGWRWDWAGGWRSNLYQVIGIVWVCQILLLSSDPVSKPVASDPSEQGRLKLLFKDRI